MKSRGSRSRMALSVLEAATRCNVRRFGRHSATPVWIGVLAITVAAAHGRPVSADTSSPTLDDAWFESVARSESLMSTAASRGGVDSAGCAVVAEQIRIGVDVLGAIVLASVVADTVVA